MHKTKGQLKLDKVMQYEEVCVSTTSEDGQFMILEQRQSLHKEFSNLYDDIKATKDQLG